MRISDLSAEGRAALERIAALNHTTIDKVFAAYLAAIQKNKPVNAASLFLQV